MRRRFTAIAILSVVIPVVSASAQLVFKVCGETCPDPFKDPVSAAACHSRIALCESKLTAYNGYMGQLGAGVTTYALPATYRELLQPFYSGSLSNWRFAFGDRQPPNNATTDCNVTYFNRQSFVNSLRNGTLDADWEWLFHELRHFSQCSILGSRDAYAKMWFGHLELAFIQNNDLSTLHDRMWMENDANNYEPTMMENTKALRDVNNRLVKPISVKLLGPGGNALPDQSTFSIGKYVITGKVDGGSDPLERQWWVKSPFATTYSRVQNGLSVDQTSWEFSPNVTGQWTLRLLVRQPGSNLAPASRQVILNVSDVRKTSM